MVFGEELEEKEEEEEVEGFEGEEREVVCFSNSFIRFNLLHWLVEWPLRS